MRAALDLEDVHRGMDFLERRRVDLPRRLVPPLRELVPNVDPGDRETRGIAGL